MSFKKIFVGLAASALLVASGTASAQKTQFVSVLTGGQSGVYYPVGVAIAQNLADNIDNLRATAQVTKMRGKPRRLGRG